MLTYIARRLAWAAVVVLAVLLITFLVFFELPAGDPAQRFAGKSPTPRSLALIRERLHLDDPWYVEFGYFVKNFVAGDENGWPGLGYSYKGYVPVKDQITARAPRTLWLVFGAATIWLVLKHGLRASLTPIVTMFGLDVALLVGGAVIIESVFNLQGPGWLAVTSVQNQDLPT